MCRLVLPLESAVCQALLAYQQEPAAMVSWQCIMASMACQDKDCMQARQAKIACTIIYEMPASGSGSNCMQKFSATMSMTVTRAAACRPVLLRDWRRPCRHMPCCMMKLVLVLSAQCCNSGAMSLPQSAAKCQCLGATSGA